MNGAKEITVEDIENFLNSEDVVPPATNVDDINSQSDKTEAEIKAAEEKSQNQTQAFAHRLKEATEKVRNEERNAMAKRLGYDNYESFAKAFETNLLKEKGLDETEVGPIIETIVNKRLEDDPRLKEFEAYKRERVNEWAKKELAELKELSGGKITKLEDVPKDVIELWKKKGSLKGAFLELQGEALIKEARKGIVNEQTKSSTSHLNNPAGNPTGKIEQRPYTQEEKELYKLFNPEVTDEQLSKLVKNK